MKFLGVLYTKSLKLSNLANGRIRKREAHSGLTEHNIQVSGYKLDCTDKWKPRQDANLCVATTNMQSLTEKNVLKIAKVKQYGPYTPANTQVQSDRKFST